jgi:alpha-1,3-rhamnosyl/mannosyltransferase
MTSSGASRTVPPIGVLLGADSLISLRSGIGRVTVEIARMLRRHPDIGALRLWVGEQLEPPAFLDENVLAGNGVAAAPRRRPVRIMLGRVPGVQLVRGALRKHAMQADLAAMSNTAPGGVVYHETNMITKPFDGVTVVHVHDLSWVHHRALHPVDRIRWIDRNLDRTLRGATRFVAVSDFTAREFAAHFDIPVSRIDVVPNGVDAMFEPRTETDARGTLARLDLQDKSYVLSVSTLEPRKNFDRLLAAHRALPPADRRRFPLVIVGGQGWGETLDNRDAEEARRDGTMRLLGHLPDAELVDLTARAACVAYVSLYEGFGLPVLEAMACGAPVVASSTTATGETAGDAALLVDPVDVDDIARGLAEVIGDPGRAADLRARGLERAAWFDWQRTTDGLLGAWARALHS